ncbi:MAG: glycosyltransferase [Candidatus Cloacimonetes bacterium]|nr:glycosyltransferase [Candidatus Cloacimonadota bacterium]
MKIFILGYTYTSHQNGLLMARAFAEEGYTVNVCSLATPWQEIVSSVRRFNPDFVFQTGGRDVSNKHLLELKHLGYKLVLWYPDAYGPNFQPDIEFFKQVKGKFDLILSTVKGIVPQLEEYTDRAVWGPQYYDQMYYKPTIERLDLKHEIYDVCFIGNNNKGVSPDRDVYIPKLYEKYKIKVVGKGFNVLSIYVETSEIANIYRNSKIALNFTTVINPTLLQMSDRIYKILGCGTFCLTQSIQGLEQLFQDGKHLVVFNGYEDLCEKIEYYLEHEDKREEIALEGQKEVLKKHTINIRVNQYLKAIKEIL